MKAIVYERYGPPDILELTEVEKSTPKDDEILVKVRAASLNAGDWHALRGTPFLQRLESGFPKPKNKILGADVAGLVEAVGSKVTRFQPGDEVYGDLYWCGFGAFAEYVCVPEDAAALKPANIPFEAAAAVPQAAFTALHALRDQGQVQPGQKVLINGASGGVGTFAVQIAKSFGAEVTGVCSTRNLEMMRSLGADQVIDYTQEDFPQNSQKYDLIVDIAANHSLSDLKRVLTPQGICVIVGFSTLMHMLKVTLLGPLISKAGSKKLGMLMPKENKQDLADMKELLESGKVVPVIDRLYSFSEIPEAIRYLEKGHARGKIVITM
ncbi:MAG: NAD(P)-dependent alcohol dehydrogenase [Anaerolineales bacterium]|nr:NAD(P)-dependent alcohol dehydrogenase [Chloroflexota bacterium]MBL6980390.1 NAD(P)-dependent alcohol dehydrogenase [Anaerolineales bacterium]